MTFLRALSAGTLFDDPASLKTMLEFVNAPDAQSSQKGYGLGVAQFDAGGIILIGHLGGTAGFQSFVFLHPDSGVAASVHMNRAGDFGAFIVPVLDAIRRIP